MRTWEEGGPRAQNTVQPRANRWGGHCPFTSRMPPTPVLSPLDRSPSYAEDSPTSGTPTPLRQVGTWDPLLQCLSLDTPLLEQQNTKKPYRTKNNCRPAQLAKFWTKDTKRAKNLTVLLKILKQKQGMGSTEQGTAHRLHSTPPEAKEKSESVRPTVTPWTVAHRAPLSTMGFSRQEYWSGLVFPSPRDLPNPGIKPRFLTLQADFCWLSHQGNPTPPNGEANGLSHSGLTPGTYPPTIQGIGSTPFGDPASKETCYLFTLPSAAAGAPVKPCLNFLSDL